MKQIRLAIITVFLSAAGVFFVGGMASAWIGSGGDAPPSGSGGGGGGGSGDYAVDSAGVSWMYYKFDGGSSAVGQSLQLWNLLGAYPWYQYSGHTISGTCAKKDYGFWHYGINGHFTEKNNTSPTQTYHMPLNAQGVKYSKNYNKWNTGYRGWTKNAWGHWYTTNANTYGKGFYKTNKGGKKNVDHGLFKSTSSGWVYMYDAIEFGDPWTDDSYPADVLAAYKYVYKEDKGEEWDKDYVPGDVYAFCAPYGTVTGRTSTYTGSVKATVTDDSNDNSVSSTTDDPGDSQTIEVAGEDYTVKFVHKITRTDTQNYAVTNPWETDVEDGTSGLYGQNARGTAASGSKETKANDTYTVRSYTYSGKIYAGQTITYCETLNYHDKIVENSTASSEDSVKACIKIKRTKSVCSNLQGDLAGKIYSYDEGQNWGQIGVRNKSLSNDFTLVNGGVGSIYAKPGDEVRFRYNYCAGGVYARALGGGDTVNGISYRPSSNSSGAVSQRLISNYLFEDSVSTFEGDDLNGSTTAKTFSFDGINASNMASNVSKIDKRYHSPGRSARYRSCNTTIEDNGTSDEHYYKVVGKGPFAADGSLDGCYNRTRTLDVGHTFSQTLTWNDYGLVNGNKYNNGDTSATAEVKVPYNYTLAPYVSNESNNPGRVAYVGEEINMTPGVVVQGRKNLAFPEGDNEYATITKPTELRVKYYYKTSGGSIISEASSSSSRSGFRLNANGLLDGTTDNESQKSINDGGTKLDRVNIKIPNSVNVGDQVCVELSVYPADSHDVRSASVVNGEGIAGLMEGSTLDINNPANWATAISCSTIAKKPTMSVESSNAYSATKFKTAQYARYNGDARRINFGSWSEYGVYGRVDLTAGTGSLFASGAALGYSRDGYPNALGVNAPRTNDTASADANKISTKSNSDKCTFMTQTFANSSCETGSANIGGVSARQYSERIKERYSGGSEVFEVQGLPTRNIAGTTYYDVSGYNSADVIMAESGVVRFHATNNLYVNALPNLSNDQFAEKGVTKPNPTIVYDAPGKNIVIDGNLGYDGGAKSTIDSLAQVIIVAKNVYFTDAPTYINAIIVADNVNTCKYSGGENVSVGGAGGAVTLTNTRCSQALQFDAPVVTKKIVLNRTAGAGSGDDSIKRAEIFNLNMANYLWSFNQMSRLSQAVTTYAREMPTRY